METWNRIKTENSDLMDYTSPEAPGLPSVSLVQIKSRKTETLETGCLNVVAFNMTLNIKSMVIRFLIIFITYFLA